MSDAPRKRPAFEPGAQLLAPTAYDPAMKRPVTTIIGAILVVFRAVVGVLVLAGIAVGWDGLLRNVDSLVELLTPLAVGDTRALALGTGAVLLGAEVVMAVLIFLGVNWPRVLIMLVAVVDIAVTFAAWSLHGSTLALQGSLYSLALDILILLALSSRRAAAYARRREHRQAAPPPAA